MNYVNIFLTTEQLVFVEKLLIANEVQDETGVITETLDAICEQKTSQGVN
tara:strand:+ start:644 stop:793 length:150 start_codon:yes stop_codon:yes gene_type:complete